MDVDLTLGTEQALMLHFVYISYFVVMKICLVLSLRGGHGGGAHPSSDQRARWQSRRSCACNGSKYVQNSSLAVLVRRSALYVMKKKPCLHDGRVTIDLDKNRLVEIPHSGRNHQTTDSHGFC